ncbi:hypothetical protein GLOTRDRAFT_130460 [Gloeophyllum trabeum ATCC 11539]|uniref:Uncharacterized protein n=1 Tax=Gloeophyllum trabeum (strain ATCC 11539 / FP-39264 / Madison 617) TaxID=670483 RepID=S7Q3E7_GLOTA|nr:uncharacterized protein GLOTRDRAFT_130460 [Gloeophyllum trabeum ATCC 11539]EPQ54077.1 hypothetical protein GLOTRDRAFT_130460 [Gloeophyllum trabeum ATCC 11539]
MAPITMKKIQPMTDLVLNQSVQVRIRTNVWVMGIIVGFLECLNKITGMAYQVEYTTPMGPQRSYFGPDDIRLS